MKSVLSLFLPPHWVCSSVIFAILEFQSLFAFPLMDSQCQRCKQPSTYCMLDFASILLSWDWSYETSWFPLYDLFTGGEWLLDQTCQWYSFPSEERSFSSQSLCPVTIPLIVCCSCLFGCRRLELFLQILGGIAYSLLLERISWSSCDFRFQTVRVGWWLSMSPQSYWHHALRIDLKLKFHQLWPHSEALVHFPVWWLWFYVILSFYSRR